MGAVVTVLSLSMTTLLCAGDRQDKDPSAVSWVLLEMPNSTVQPGSSQEILLLTEL